MQTVKRFSSLVAAGFVIFRNLAASDATCAPVLVAIVAVRLDWKTICRSARPGLRRLSWSGCLCTTGTVRHCRHMRDAETISTLYTRKKSGRFLEPPNYRPWEGDTMRPTGSERVQAFPVESRLKARSVMRALMYTLFLREEREE